jgi:hypothetical protein
MGFNSGLKGLGDVRLYATVLNVKPCPALFEGKPSAQSGKRGHAMSGRTQKLFLSLWCKISSPFSALVVNLLKPTGHYM